MWRHRGDQPLPEHLTDLALLTGPSALPALFLVIPQVSFVCHSVKSHKSLKRAGIGQRLVHEVLCIQLQKDGSDTWRLEPVVELLKQGGVSDGGGGMGETRTTFD